MPDNWYNLIETQIVNTIQSDAWLGTAGTTVVTTEARLRQGPRSYYDHELPAIAVKVIGKRQGDFTMTTFDKFYRFVAMIIDRGGDLEQAVNDVQKISSALEDLLESQHDTDNDLHGLGTHADIVQGPVCEVGGGVIEYAQDAENSYTIVATMTGEVNIVLE